jgi:hypothetical protein
MVPLLSASTSLIMSCSSDSDGFWPSDRMTVPSSLVVICPNNHHQHRDSRTYVSASCRHANEKGEAADIVAASIDIGDWHRGLVGIERY